MDADTPLAPPVVAVIVVHEPGEWFDETVASLAGQDYPNLNCVFLVAGTDPDEAAETADRVHAILPDAYVQDLGANPGFGSAANSVLELVEGDQGFFCFGHDDIALEPATIRLMVEELYRSNAGIVGPKLVDWDDPHLLVDVGLDVDRFGQSAPRIDVGEYDQEQHDTVTDVFAVPSACFLMRADLFRSLGGFDPAIDFHGEDVDLCWRAHISGARVMVAPSARVRHAQQMEMRRPDLHHRMLRARHRMRSVLTLTAGARLPARLAQLIALTGAELVLGLFNGRVGEAWASTRALIGAIPRFPTLLARRGAIAKLRNVSDAEVHGLQSSGSNQLRAIVRNRDTRMFIGVDDTVRRWRDRSVAPVLTWVAIVVAVLVASRTLINTAVPHVGEFLPLPSSARSLWRDYVTGWNPSGLGGTSPNPTGYLALALLSVVWLFHMGLGLTMLVVGSVLFGAVGVWRLSDLFPSNRERTLAVITYVAMPIVPGIISTGGMTALITYAVLPWFVHLLRLAVGIGTADPDSVAADLVDGVIDLGLRERLRRTAVTGIAVAIAVALAPPVVLVVIGVTIVLAVTSLLVGAAWRTGAWMLGCGLAAAAIAWLLNVPASPRWSWSDLTAVPLAGPRGRGLTDVAAMNIGLARLGILALALYVPVITGLVLCRAWRLTWAARAAGLVLAFGPLAVLQDRDVLPWSVPDVGVLLVPVALGLSLSAACALASFAADVAGRSFGWRQPLGLLSIAAVVCGVVPSLLTLTDGSWFAPRTTLAELVAPQVPADPDFGDFRVLYLGDPRVLPGVPRDLGGGIALTVTGPGAPDIRSRWAAPESAATGQLMVALDDIAANATQRGGRLLAPFGIRYVVVPLIDGAGSTENDPIDPPSGLLGALGSQLDLALRYSPTGFAVFENTSAFPTVAEFTGGMVAPSAATQAAELVQTDLSGATPVFDGALTDRAARDDVGAGVVHLATTDHGDWTLDVDGQPVSARSGFGTFTAFDVTADGPAQLVYESPASRRNALLLQAALWLVVVVAASRLRIPDRFRGRRAPLAINVINLDDDHADLPVEGGEVPVLVPVGRSRPPGDRFGASDQAPATLFRADDPDERAAWVDEMFAADDDGDR
ncbi:glycosyltransferase [soil metagenome]